MNNVIKNNKLLTDKDFWVQLSLFAGIFLLMYFWYKPYTQVFPFGADIRSIRWTSSTPLGQSLSTAFIAYRPVILPVFYLLINLFGYNMMPYFIVNLLINSSVALFLYRKTKIISNNHYIGLGISILYAISNFGLYGIVQLEGLMELLCMLFLFFYISAIYDLLYGEIEKANKYFIIALINYLLIIFTHERFIVLILPLIIVLIYKYNRLFKKLVILSLISVMPLLMNIFLKKIVFNIVFFRGTGSRLINPKISSIVSHIRQHIKYLFGIHEGRADLNGITPQDVSLYVYIFIWGSIIAFTLLCLIYICSNINKSDNSNFILRKSVFFTILCLITIGILIVSSSITSHVEQRWVYAPYLAMIFLLSHIFAESVKLYPAILKIIAWFKKNISKTYFLKTLYIIFFIYSLTTFCYSFYYRNYFNNIFFITWHEGGRKYLEYKYEFGKPIALGTSYSDYTVEDNKYIISGLDTEEWFSWSNGEKMTMIFFFEDVSNDLIFDADIDTILLETEEVQLHVNDQFVDVLHLSKTNLGRMRFYIKKEFLYYGPNTFTFRFPQAISPAELGINEDNRKLAVALKYIVIGPYDTITTHD